MEKRKYLNFKHPKITRSLSRVLEPQTPVTGVLGWSLSCHFGPAPISVHGSRGHTDNFFVFFKTVTGTEMPEITLNMCTVIPEKIVGAGAAVKADGCETLFIRQLPIKK